jgi:hypothetical protein
MEFMTRFISALVDLHPPHTVTVYFPISHDWVLTRAHQRDNLVLVIPGIASAWGDRSGRRTVGCAACRILARDQRTGR